ncbi:nuclear transport factor 2 family protein [Pelagibacterium sp. H642]|uniref:nuclear transport factor 2 family protein n=1 Tax=Pelagibacterium sp. H642 TaxID=1881069 RepID=UPI002814A94A|nr:nuclear transport factor 2 family protein [Pelagibacterium sp. H642]WMT92694.1 nuclear transport factor 2 family protein [Pelagibacterium sp. H642]
MDDEIAWKTEIRLWLEGISAYDELLDPSCLMAFPGIGVLNVPAIIEGLKGAPRWTDVKMSDRVITRAGDAVVVLGYTAEGKRENAHPYRCFCTSTYRAEGLHWKLVQHQQTLAS